MESHPVLWDGSCFLSQLTSFITLVALQSLHSSAALSKVTYSFLYFSTHYI